MTNFELLRLTLRNDDDAVALRHVAARTARLVHLDAADVTKVATSVSELGRLAQDYLPAELVVAVGSRPAQRGVLVIELIFGADRMPPLARAIDVAPTAAAALTAVGRLMDQTEIASDRIVISKLLVKPLAADEPARLRDQLMMEPPGDLRAALRSQNEELVATLVALRERESRAGAGQRRAGTDQPRGRRPLRPARGTSGPGARRPTPGVRGTRGCAASARTDGRRPRVRHSLPAGPG